jgi:hypothetical protein
MMKTARTSETSVDNYFTWQDIPKDKSELHTRRRENVKSHKVLRTHILSERWQHALWLPQFRDAVSPYRHDHHNHHHEIWGSHGDYYSVLSNFLRPVKDHLALKTLGLYSIPCKCGEAYIGQTGRSIETRVREHHRHIRLQHLEKSAIAELSINLGHRIQLHNTSIPASKSRYMDRIIREATEIEPHPNNINRDNSFSLIRSWKPLIRVLREHKLPLTRTRPPPYNLPEGSLLVRSQFPYSLALIGYLPSALALQILYKPSTSLPCHFSPSRWIQHISPKRRHRPANTHNTKTQDFYNNMIIWHVSVIIFWRQNLLCTVLSISSVT